MEQTNTEYKTRHNLVEKAIHWELCKKLKFDYTTKWYMHKPESVLGNEKHKDSLEFLDTDRSPYHIYQLLRSGGIWHKVNFKRSLKGLNSGFSLF